MEDNKPTIEEKEAKIVDYIAYEIGKLMLNMAVGLVVSVIVVGILYCTDSSQADCKATGGFSYSPWFFIILELIVVMPLLYYGIKYIEKGTTQARKKPTLTEEQPPSEERG